MSRTGLRYPSRTTWSVIAVAVVVLSLVAVMLWNFSQPRADQADGSATKRSASAQDSEVERRPSNESENLRALEKYEDLRVKLAAIRARLGKPIPVEKMKVVSGKPGQAAADPYAVNPYAGTSNKAPDCQTQQVSDVTVDSTHFYVQQPNSQQLRVVMDPQQFCRIAVSNTSSATQVYPGFGQRIYYIEGDANAAAQSTVGHFAYQLSLSQKDQKYSATPTAGYLYFKAVPSVDVLRQTNSCYQCDFRLAEFAGGIRFENANLAQSDFSGALVYNIGFGSGSSLVSSRFGKVGDQPAILSSSDFAGSDISGTQFNDLTIDETTTFADAEISGEPVTFANSVVPYPLLPLWENASFAGLSFMVSRGAVGALKGTPDQPTKIAVQIRDSRFVGSRPDFSYTDWQMSDLDGTDFSGADLTNSRLCGVSAVSATFIGSPMTAVNLSGANLRGANFDRALLGTAIFSDALLGGRAKAESAQPANPQMCRAADPAMDVGPASMRYIDARGGDFLGVDARRVDFSNSYLFKTGSGGPVFSEANLTSARFDGALIGAGDFSYSNLSSTSFQAAQCIGCKFTNATVSTTNFRNSYLYGSEFSDALILDHSDFRDSLCCSTATETWNFGAGIGSIPTSVQYSPTNMSGQKFAQVDTCPSGSSPDQARGCDGYLTPRSPPPNPPPCVAAASYICSSQINTVVGTGKAGYTDGSDPSRPDSPGLASKAQLNNPSRVVAYQYVPDPGSPLAFSNRLLIADTGNNIVRSVDVTTHLITVVAGQPTMAGFSGDGGLATSAQLSGPTGIATDSFGRIYIADTGNNRIRVVELDGTIQTIAGTGKPEVLNAPQGVAVTCGVQQSDCVTYVADTGSKRIRRVSQTGKLSLIAGNGQDGKPNSGSTAKTAPIGKPVAVTVDSFGNVMIADQSNNAIWLVDVTGKIYPYAPSGPTQKILSPSDIALDPRDNAYISMNQADWNQVTRLNAFVKNDPGPIVGTSGVAGYAGDLEDSLAAKINAPGGVTIAPWGQVFIADTGNQRIRSLSS